jgi:hypothetical protein
MDPDDRVEREGCVLLLDTGPWRHLPDVRDEAKRSLSCFTSIGAWILLAAAGHYFHRQLTDPCTTFQLLQDPVHQRFRFWRRQQQVPTCLQRSEGTWSDQAKCLLPEVLYDTNDFTYATCQDNAAALWTLLPFRAAMLIAVVSAVFELYVMVVIGRPFCLDSTAYTSSIKAFRDMLFSVLETAAIYATLVSRVRLPAQVLPPSTRNRNGERKRCRQSL